MLDSLSAALRPELVAARYTDPEGEQGNAGGNRKSLDRMTRILHRRFSQPETHSQWWSSPLRRPVIRKNYGNDILPEAYDTALSRRCFLRKYLQVDKH